MAFLKHFFEFLDSHEQTLMEQCVGLAAGEFLITDAYLTRVITLDEQLKILSDRYEELLKDLHRIDTEGIGILIHLKESPSMWGHSLDELDRSASSIAATDPYYQLMDKVDFNSLKGKQLNEIPVNHPLNKFVNDYKWYYVHTIQLHWVKDLLKKARTKHKKRLERESIEEVVQKLNEGGLSIGQRVMCLYLLFTKANIPMDEGKKSKAIKLISQLTNISADDVKKYLPDEQKSLRPQQKIDLEVLKMRFSEVFAGDMVADIAERLS